MLKAVVYTRVSSREQEREGYSIQAQQRLLLEYAQRNRITIVAEYSDIESAKGSGRKDFGKMLEFLDHDRGCRVLLVEKTDRLYRNQWDSFKIAERIEEANLEVHLVKEGRVLNRNSRSHDKFAHRIQSASSQFYSDNLSDEVKKGMREKAEQGIYPSRAPIGYRHNRTLRNIEIDPEKAPVVRRIFELYATGTYSLN
jgi:site-specific DNA recombinase